MKNILTRISKIFLLNSHYSTGSVLYKTEINSSNKIHISFFGQMNYAYKFYDAWHTAYRTMLLE